MGRLSIKLVSLEDGTTASGFRKFAAYATRRDPDTTTYYVSTHRWVTIRSAIKGTMGDKAEIPDWQIEEIAAGLAGADIVGFSSMTGYAALTHRVIKQLRAVAPDTFIVWGGIHPIIHPENAISADVDGICTGEGEFAWETLMECLEVGADHRQVKNFWFKDRATGDVTRNHFLALMSSADMETLPFALYGHPNEHIYQPGSGFRTMGLRDYLASDGLGYTALWSIGCPFHCTYCGNTAFIANDKKYKKIRHTSARYIVDEVKAVKKRFPHLTTVRFLDDSFMAIPYAEIERFAELWHDELGDIPFSVYGVIPNYVKRDKFEILTWAGMNRIRMGIQSGSQRILDFYERPSPPKKILAAGEICASFAPEYHIPPLYDVIVDNPIETREDVLETLWLMYEMPRPYSLLIYSLKVIPNTELAAAMEAEGIDLEEISSSYAWIPPKAANLLLYVLAVWKPPLWLWKRLLRHAQASTTPQPEYPRLAIVLRTLYLIRRTLSHIRRMDFSITPGMSGYIVWRLGVVGWWNRKLNKHYPKPPPKPRRKVEPPAGIVKPALKVMPPSVPETR